MKVVAFGNNKEGGERTSVWQFVMSQTREIGKDQYFYGFKRHDVILTRKRKIGSFA